MTSRGSLRVTLRHALQPGDLGRVTEQHARLYAEEYGLDIGFEAYVAETIGEFGRGYRPDRDRLWLAETDGRLAGSVAIVGRTDTAAQLRWLLVDPVARGSGLGRRLVAEAVAFSRDAGYRSVFLWTIDPLQTAARIYLAQGFTRTETLAPRPMWGATLSEERYDLSLG